MRWMRLALELGARGQGRVWPNPAVGCVLVKAGRVIGRGWTHPGGRPHAETVALAHAGLNSAKDATAYVSLEPCAHHGHTPPCVDALIAAGVRRVVIALEDPDPRTNGKGIARLLNAGIEVQTDVLKHQATHAHLGFIHRITQNRPMVTLKLATSIDGRIATATGDSKWISGPEARRLVHAMRARHDAVLIGAGTARADNPQLITRGLGVTHQPVRVVASRRLDLPMDSALMHSASTPPVWLCHGPDAPESIQHAWRNAGAHLLQVPLATDGQLDLSMMLQKLADAGLTRILCEGGGTLAASLLVGGFADELALFSAGLAIGAEGTPSIGVMGIAILAEGPRFTLRHTQSIGNTSYSVWARRNETD